MLSKLQRVAELVSCAVLDIRGVVIEGEDGVEWEELVVSLKEALAELEEAEKLLGVNSDE